MFLVLVAACLLFAFAVVAFAAGIGIAAVLAAVVVGAALLAALATIAFILAARHAEAVRRRSSRARVLSDIRALESRLMSSRG
jgi:hypothetical protein